MGVHGNEGAFHIGHLHEMPLPLLAARGHINNIAQGQHISCLFDFRAEFRAVLIGPRPAHQRHGNGAGFARRFRFSIGQQFGLKANGRLLFIHLKNNGQAPWRDIGGGLGLSSSRPQSPWTSTFLTGPRKPRLRSKAIRPLARACLA